MAWESRGEAGPYYFRAKRVNGKVVKEYLGRGARAEQAAREDFDRRAARAAKRQAVRDETTRIRPALALTNDVGSDANLLVEAVFLASGLHKHNYGRWRVRRGG